MAHKSSQWPSTIVECVLSGTQDPRITERIDDLLQWLSGTDTKRTRRIDRAFARRPVEISRAKQLATEFIDKAYISYHRNPWGMFALEDSLVTPDDIRTRYRRLIRIFHPDRGYGDSDWLASRSEIINSAYQQLLDGDIKASDTFHHLTGEVVDIEAIEAMSLDMPLRLRISQALASARLKKRLLLFLLLAVGAAAVIVLAMLGSVP